MSNNSTQTGVIKPPKGVILGIRKVQKLAKELRDATATLHIEIYTDWDRDGVSLSPVHWESSDLRSLAVHVSGAAASLAHRIHLAQARAPKTPKKPKCKT